MKQIHLVSYNSYAYNEIPYTRKVWLLGAYAYKTLEEHYLQNSIA